MSADLSRGGQAKLFEQSSYVYVHTYVSRELKPASLLHCLFLALPAAQEILNSHGTSVRRFIHKSGSNLP